MSEQNVLPEYEYKKVPITEKNDEKEDSPPKYGYGVRHVQVAIFFLCLTVNIIGRGHMGVTIVAMTNSPELSIVTNNTLLYFKTQSNITLINQSNPNLTTADLEFNVTDRNTENVLLDNSTQKLKIFNWPKSIQEMVLNAFFLGYMIVMLPMGMVCQRYGGKLPMQVGLFVNGVVSIITPWVALWGGWKGICCCRIIQGVTQAGTYPSLQNLIAKWVPEHERASLGACVHSGLSIGPIIAFQLAGFLGASKWGWPSIYYAVGVICLLCFIVLTIFGAANPLEHKTISEEERNYVMGPANDGNSKKIKTPWRAIFTSKPLWGTIAAHIGTNAAFVFFFNQVPTYIHYTLDIDVRNQPAHFHVVPPLQGYLNINMFVLAFQSGLLSSLPYMASIFTNLLFGWLADYCSNHNIVSKNNTRRICNSIASFGMVVCLILTSYTSNIIIVVACLIAAMAANMGCTNGWMVNYIDLSPNFASTILSIGNMLGNILVVLIPIVVSYVVTDMTNVIQWRIMFFITAAVAILCNTIFLIVMSTDVQPWNYADQNESCTEDMEDKQKELRMTESLHSNNLDSK